MHFYKMNHHVTIIKMKKQNITSTPAPPFTVSQYLRLEEPSVWLLSPPVSFGCFSSMFKLNNMVCTVCVWFL